MAKKADIIKHLLEQRKFEEVQGASIPEYVMKAPEYELSVRFYGRAEVWLNIRSRGDFNFSSPSDFRKIERSLNQITDIAHLDRLLSDLENLYTTEKAKQVEMQGMIDFVRNVLRRRFNQPELELGCTKNPFSHSGRQEFFVLMQGALLECIKSPEGHIWWSTPYDILCGLDPEYMKLRNALKAIQKEGAPQYYDSPEYKTLSTRLGSQREFIIRRERILLNAKFDIGDFCEITENYDGIDARILRGSTGHVVATRIISVQEEGLYYVINGALVLESSLKLIKRFEGTIHG